MCSNTTGTPPITTIHPDIIQSHILNRLDGQTLASTSCASAQLLSLCTEDILWQQICHSTFPATNNPTVRRAIAGFPSGHRGFFSDAFPSVRRPSLGLNSKLPTKQTTEFISAVDIHYDDVLIYSSVTTTETLSSWFLSSPFRIDLLSPKETISTPMIFDGGACDTRVKEWLRVSWILIDPVMKRAVNIASARAVESRRHWLTEEVQLRYATVLHGGDGELVQCAVVVNCGGKDGGEMQVREVSMQVEDIEGKILTGFDCLGILETVMEGERWKSDEKVEEDIYESFLREKMQCRERMQKREKSMDLVCIGFGVSIFFAIWMFLLAR